MKVNLHLHSKYSDGTQWPEEIIIRASKVGLNQVALTDHDCMEGVDVFLLTAKTAGLKAISGVEIDCMAPEIKYNSEVLGYFPRGKWTHTRDFCLARMQHREKRIKQLISRAAKFYNASLSFEELKTRKLGILPPGLPDPRVSYSKPDLFGYLMHKQLIAQETDYSEFKKLPFLVRASDPKPLAGEVVEVILRDDGIPVLPHPGLIFNRKIDLMKEEGKAIFEWFKIAGIRAVECNYYKDNKGDNTSVLNHLTREFAEELDLKITWGSDCHGVAHKSDTMEVFWGTDPFPFPDF